ncbi:50S ribosomal protein L36e [Exophiala viscosa]|uniref:50S ribosomal protein L36e n=1 Tax=Exophiala viscosa TaxID=2486360 RepID=UPI002193703C|nr:50S ribosomal protein L36e [Exophiala viscosa]
MRITLLVPLLVSLFTFVQSQSLPSCAANCLEEFLPQSGCNATDAACICADVSLMGNVQTCTLASCTIKESLTAKNATATLCQQPVRDNTAITPVITAVSGLLAIVCVLMRLADKYPHWERLQWADLCVVISLLLAIPMAVLEFYMSSAGFGKDIWTISFDNITRIVQFTWLTEIFYMMTIGFTKMALLLLYWRVFPTQPFRKFVLASVVVCAAYIPTFALGIALHCLPISYTWTSWIGETTGHCTNLNAFAWAHAIINIVFDLWIIVLPIPQLLQLALGRKKKIQITLMFSVGLFITIVSVVRLTSLVQFANSTNATYDNVPTAYWSVLEAFVSIICTCLPAIRALLRRVFPSCFGTTRDASSDSRTYRVTKSPMNSGNMSKSGGHSVTVEARSEDSDAIELVQKSDRKDAGHDGW